jgi:ABC-2 type transport system permease protein
VSSRKLDDHGEPIIEPPLLVKRHGDVTAVAFPMLFLGGVVFPVDSAPGWLRPVTAVMPLTYLASALRSIILDGQSLPDVWLQALVLVATALVGLAIAVRFFRWESSAV